MPFPILLVAGAVIGAGLAANAAHGSNKNVKRAARANYAILSENQGQLQGQFYDQLGTAQQRYRTNASGFQNAIAGKSGSAYRSYASQIAADAALDTGQLTNNLATAINSLQNEKENVKRGAQSNLQSVGLQALQGGIQGAMAGAALDSSLSNLSSASSAASQAKAVGSVASKYGEAGMLAMNAGLSAMQINSGRYDSYINQNYASVQQSRNIALESARSMHQYNTNMYMMNIRGMR